MNRKQGLQTNDFFGPAHIAKVIGISNSFLGRVISCNDLLSTRSALF